MVWLRVLSEIRFSLLSLSWVYGWVDFGMGNRGFMVVKVLRVVFPSVVVASSGQFLVAGIGGKDSSSLGLAVGCSGWLLFVSTRCGFFFFFWWF